MTNQSQELASLVKDLIETNQDLASALVRIITSIEQIAGYVPGERDLSLIVSQLSGLHIRASEILEGDRSSVDESA